MNNGIDPVHWAEAERRVAAQEKAARDRLIREIAISLQGEAHRVDSGRQNCPPEAGSRKWSLDEKRKRLAELDPPAPIRNRFVTEFVQPVPVVRAAAEEAEIDQLRAEIATLEVLVRQDERAGLLQPDAA